MKSCNLTYKQDSERSAIGGEDDKLRNTSVQSLGGFVGTLLELTSVYRGVRCDREEIVEGRKDVR